MEVGEMTLKQLTRRLDEASDIVVPRLRKAGNDAMADALATEVSVLRRIAPKNRRLWKYYEGWIFGFAHAAGVAEALAGLHEGGGNVKSPRADL
jgi:hypothetical protein